MTTLRYRATSARESIVPGRLLRKSLVVVWMVLVTLGALEVAVRIWGYSERYIYDPIYTLNDRADDIPYVHKPNLTQARARGLAVINTDSLGLRAKTAGATYGIKQSNEYRIAIVGDSCTFGEGIARTEDTFAQVLEDILNQRQQAVNVKVFNYGTSAYSVKEMAATLRYRMPDIQPDLVFMAIIPRDFRLARTPTIDAAGYLIDQKMSVLSSSPAATRVLREVHLSYVLRDIALRWFSNSQDIAQALARGEIPESYEYIRQFKDTAEESRFSYAVVLLPYSSWSPVPDQLTRDGIQFLDLSFIRNEFTDAQYMASRFDPHPSVAVHHRIGETLADYVRRNSLKFVRQPQSN